MGGSPAIWEQFPNLAVFFLLKASLIKNNRLPFVGVFNCIRLDCSNATIIIMFDHLIALL